MFHGYQRAVQALQNKRFFKLTLGASFSNPREIERLSYIYTLAGAHAIDIMAAPRLVRAALKGINKAKKQNRRVDAPLVMVSIQSDEDPHFQKAWMPNRRKIIIPKEIRNLCPTGAIGEEEITTDLCIGCGLCVNDRIPIKMRPLRKISEDLLAACLKEGAEGIEFHLGQGDIEKFDSLFGGIKGMISKEILLSVTVGSNRMSPAKVEEVVTRVNELMTGRQVIFQADGTPMSGQDGKSSTLQTLAVAQLVQPLKKDHWLQASGGTNRLTATLAKDFQIELNGVAMGTYARKVLAGIDLDVVDGSALAVLRAKKLVRSVKP